MDVSSDSQIDFVIDEHDTSMNGAQGMSDADHDTTLGSPNDGHLPPASNAADASTASGSHVPTPGGHVTPVSDAAPMTSATTSVNPMAMGPTGGTPAMRFGGPSAMDLASGGGGHLTTTFGGPPAVGLVGGGGGYTTTAADGLLSAMGFTGGAPATQAINGHLVTNTGANLPTPGLACGPPAATGGHQAVSSSYPPSLGLLDYQASTVEHPVMHGNTSPPTANAVTTAPCFTLGIAAGDGDLMPPRFSGDRRIDADDWVQDLLDYVAIRRIPATDAALLLRTRLTGAARTWLESVPPGATFDDVIARFRKRFGASGQCRPELMTEFWERRQAPDEPAGSYIEEKARLARRMRIDSQPFVLQGIIQGLRADVRRDVMLQKPTTLEALNEAAAIADASAKAATAQSKNDGAAINAQMAEMRAMMATMQALMINNQQRPVADDSIAETSAPRQAPPTTTVSRTTPTTAATAQHPTSIAAPNTTATSAGDGSRMTIQVVMPEPSGTQHAGGGRGGDAPGRRGRGRGWRGQWSNRPAPHPTRPQQLSATDPAFQSTPDNHTTPCQNCGLIHTDGHCRAAFVICFQCQFRGHYARCCPQRQNPISQH